MTESTHSDSEPEKDEDCGERPTQCTMCGRYYTGMHCQCEKDQLDMLEKGIIL